MEDLKLFTLHCTLVKNALRKGDNVLHFDELKNTVGDEFAAVLWA